MPAEERGGPCRHERGTELGALAGVLDTLHRDCAQPLRIEWLAKKSGLSLSQFQRRVRDITGLTPRQLLTKSRIELAAQLLRTSDQALSAIAFACGFYDQAAFSRQFRATSSPGDPSLRLGEARRRGRSAASALPDKHFALTG